MATVPAQAPAASAKPALAAKGAAVAGECVPFPLVLWTSASVKRALCLLPIANDWQARSSPAHFLECCSPGAGAAKRTLSQHHFVCRFATHLAFVLFNFC